MSSADLIQDAPGLDRRKRDIVEIRNREKLNDRWRFHRIENHIAHLRRGASSKSHLSMD